MGIGDWGLAEPQKAGAEGRGTIENPILSNFKEGMPLQMLS